MYKVNVLGVDYEVIFCTALDNKDLIDASGLCNVYLKTIYINTFGIEATQEDTNFLNETLRHELVHAFAYESGLWGQSWAKDEEIVDWIALMIPKLNKAILEVNLSYQPVAETEENLMN